MSASRVARQFEERGALLPGTGDRGLRRLDGRYAPQQQVAEHPDLLLLFAHALPEPLRLFREAVALEPRGEPS